ncbi:MAG: hypothetical protein A3I89_00460 [Candidatus Harrisonbacteria bacterium RIFCSPLOWO2_02_FULL_41_11]|nr:MAG: hypothetical protein A3I89_00460 [Candidatus Harrisonbacteria bacterium RIFCSPLOWO2_02_FULL_41_11]
MSGKFIKLAIVVLFIISAVSILYILIFQGSRGLDLALEAPEEVLSGAPFDLKVNFSNNSGAVLEDARLSLVLPEGAAFWGSAPEKNIDNRILGNIGKGGLIQESYKVVIFSEGDSKKFEAALSYLPSSLGSRFQKNESMAVNVRSSGIGAELSAPKEVMSGDELEIGVFYRNDSETDFPDLELKLEYPPSFSFKSSSLEPDNNNDTWLLGGLRKNSEGQFTVKGSLVGVKGEVLDFKSNLYANYAGQKYIINRYSTSTVISSSPLTLGISVNGNADYTAKAGEFLNYTVSYINNTDAILNNFSLFAQLVGEMFDTGDIKTSGNFRGSDNALVWNSVNAPALASVAPGSAGTVNFTIKLKDQYPIRNFSDKNFTLRVNVEAASFKVFSKARLETKVGGKLAVETKAYFRDADSGILNKGPMPPKSGEATNYTIHWLLKGYGADFSNIEVRAPLGDNVKMAGIPISNAGSLPEYRAVTNEVVWRLDNLSANQGVVGGPVEAVFQVEAVPPKKYIGNYMPLIGGTTVAATDEFSGSSAVFSNLPITTALPDDLTVGQQGGVVQP